MPTTASAAPTISRSNFAFATLPDTPDSTEFASEYDPHAQTTVFGSFGDCGVLYNGQLTYLAVTDLKKLLAAPRSPSDPTLVDPTYDLVANKVVTFVPI